MICCYQENCAYAEIGGTCFMKKSEVELFLKLERSYYKLGEEINVYVECKVVGGSNVNDIERAITIAVCLAIIRGAISITVGLTIIRSSISITISLTVIGRTIAIAIIFTVIRDAIAITVDFLAIRNAVTVAIGITNQKVPTSTGVINNVNGIRVPIITADIAAFSRNGIYKISGGWIAIIAVIDYRTTINVETISTFIDDV